MISNIITTSGDNLTDLLYYQNDSGKYEFLGLRCYKVSEDEGAYIAHVDNIDDLIDNLQYLKKQLSEYNNMGS